jgi:hypothetical protein
MNTALFARLDPMAVEAQELDIISQSGKHFLVESDPVLASALLAPSAEDVVDVQDALVFDSASRALPTESAHSSITRGSVAVVSAGAREFLDTLRVFLSPAVHTRLLAKIDTSRAVVTAGLRWLPAVAARVLDVHGKNLTHGSGRRVEKMMGV